MKFRNFNKFKNMFKIKVITHNDLDGIACALLADYYIDNAICISEGVGYDNVNEVVLSTLENENYDVVLITDISVNQETAVIINEKYKDKVVLLDHHPGLDWLNDYEWAHVDNGIPNQKGNPSGVSLLYWFLIENCNCEPKKHISDFVETVRRYDTYDWKNFYNDLEPKKLNDYMGIVGNKEFFDIYKNILLFKKPLISEEVNLILKYKQREIDIYISKKDKTLTVKDIDGIKVGFVFAESNISELGNTLMEKHPELGCVIIVDLSKNKICIRSLKDRNVNCTEIAKEWYGGGGHHLASGGEIPDLLSDIIKNIYFMKYK